MKMKYDIEIYAYTRGLSARHQYVMGTSITLNLHHMVDSKALES